MGRTLPEENLSQTVIDEATLAAAVDDAVARVLAAPDLAEQDVPDEVERLLSGDGGAQAGAGATAAAGIAQQAVTLDGLEVIQEVQDPDHSVPLVAGKTTIVRAYLSYLQPVSVRGELHIARSAAGPWRTVASIGAAQLHPSRSGSSLAQLRTRRVDLDHSLNFQLPADLTAPGDLVLRMGAVRRDTGTPLPSLAALPTRTVTFHPAAPFRLRLVRVRYRYGTPPRIHEPSATDVTLIASWLRRAYPIATLELSTTTIDANQPPMQPPPEFGPEAINAQLIALRAVDVASGTDERTHYYGMVADSGFFMRGKASGIPHPARLGVVASGPTGPSTFSWDFDGSYGDWYGGHELAHTLGRFHAEFCNAGGGAPYPFPNGQLSDADERFIGIDVGDAALGLPMRVLRGTVAHDVMTYCDDQWLSSFTYAGVLERLAEEDALAAGPGTRALAGPAAVLDGAEAMVRLIAAVNVTRSSGSVTAVLPSAEAADPDPGGAAGYDVAVRVVDAEGTVLDERPAVFMPSACEEADEDVTGVVDMTLPTPAGEAVVEVLVAGQVVDSRPVGGEVSPVGAVVGADPRADSAGGPSGGSALELRWDRPEAPSGQRYTIQVSEDGGETWRTVAVDLAEPAVSLAPEELTADEITVRVLATTGTGATAERTDTVRVR
ncbi:hypothetical protein [Actinomycetospora straminea]|uniref:Fibronectin type-III domain-containing protein n=1 Tax=Actinomycetospora straminea TaxID=663607 RepID=A0ABP9EGP1_9PSEU|nr:hypothetical protein [Actinomycetospora straminea]MDD7933751.1 hypothetical protein [Actinomycetospora straminea]